MYTSWRALGPRGSDPSARVSRDLAARVWRLARPYSGHLAGLLATISLTAVLSAVPPLLYRAIIDDAIGGQRLGLLTILAVAVLVVAVAATTSQIATRWFSSHLGERVIFDLRVALFEHVQAMPFAFFTRTQTGALISRLTSDLVGGHRAFTETISSVGQTVLGVAVTVVAMLVLDVRLTLMALAIAPLFVVVTRRMRGRLHRLLGEKLEAEAAMATDITERFQVGGALLVKLLGRPRREIAGFAARARRVRDLGVETAVYSRMFHVGFALVAAVGTGLVYWVGGRAVIAGSLSLGTIVAFSAYLTQLYTPLTMLANARVDLATALVSFQRVFEVLDFPAAIVERPGAAALTQPRGHVEFDRVWFRYPAAAEVTLPSLAGDHIESDGDRRWVLRDVSFTIDPGQTVALVGPSGVGKTTTTMLLARLYDVTEGAVRIDGHDVREVTRDSLAAAVGVVAQDPHLFHDTVRSNLLFAKPDATEQELIDAARAAQIHDQVAALPDGYDTVVGQRGYRFSGGEKQRLAIARLLLQDPAVVILDEATAHLDSESERLVQRALAEALAGRSSLVIAHRLSTVVAADVLLVLDAGQIAERGTHHELMAAGGVYADLYRSQFRAGSLGRLDAGEATRGALVASHTTVEDR
ncbi:MAG: ABC transporter ATP-binding protein/permease [Actinomycetota bacterium]|nr:ABC transporter ATP-binding protein/permease [Actinomycetota bacterium]